DVEGLYGDRLALVDQGIGYILIARPHDEAAHGDVVHPVGIDLVPGGALLNTDQLPLTTSATACQHADGTEINYGTYHVLPFLPFHRSLQGSLVLHTHRVSVHVQVHEIMFTAVGLFCFLSWSIGTLRSCRIPPSVVSPATHSS